MKLSDQQKSWFEGKTILVTGAGGFIGTNLVRALCESRCRILRMSRRGCEPVETGAATVTDRPCDLREEDPFADLVGQVDLVYHLAAQTSVPVAEKDIEADFSINVQPMLNLLAACKKSDRKVSIVLAGTATEVGMTGCGCIDENTSDQPITTYDVHKLMAEKYLLCAAYQGHVQGTCLRLPNVYGPGPRSSASDRGIVNMMVSRALSGQDLTLYGSGEYLRNFIYIDDVVRAFVQAGVCIDRANMRYYNIGTAQSLTIREAFEVICRVVSARTGQEISVVEVEPPNGLAEIEKRQYVVNTQRFCEDCQWSAGHSFAEGIDATLSILLKRESDDPSIAQAVAKHGETKR